VSRSRSPDIIAALEAAARDGSLSACFVLGRLYDEGWGVRRDPRSATRWYLRAGRGGLAEAFYFVASAYDVGDGVPSDQARALSWYRKAAAARDRTAEYALALATLDGRGVRKDVAAGVRRLIRVAPHFPAAMEYLAAHYANNGRLALAKKWATRALRRGEDSARLWLAEINRRAKQAQAIPGARVKPRRRSRSSSRTSPRPRAS
jgi:TPR repeat protein